MENQEASVTENLSQSWKLLHQEETSDYCFGCGGQGHRRGACPKRKHLHTKDKLKGNTHIYINEAQPE